MREGMLHIRDVEGPKKIRSVEARLEAMEQQIFKCQGMVERGLNTNHMMITEFTNKHKIDANDIGKHLSRLYDRIDQLQAQIYDLHNQNSLTFEPSTYRSRGWSTGLVVRLGTGQSLLQIGMTRFIACRSSSYPSPSPSASCFRFSGIPRRPHDMSAVSATSDGVAAAAAAAGILFLVAAAMHQPVAGAAPAAAVHHVVGGDPGWHVASDVLAWSTGRLFTVGDTLCKSSSTTARTAFRKNSAFHSQNDDEQRCLAISGFAYEAAEDGVAEVAGEAEFEACEAGGAIRTYADGVSRVGLDGEGARYFLSADPEKCKGGLKLRVDVRATRPVPPRAEDRAVATAPAPSESTGSHVVAPLMLPALCLASACFFLFLAA
ncbi:Blue copper protein [Hordeum vulgare]|nr:Blue copper protein [Hordeum vulgare]